VRITGGVLKGRIVKVPPGVIRPAMDRMRESVFAALGGLSGLSFLDLFSGSGIIALEAASRGAGYVEAVEADRAKRRTLIENAGMSPERICCRFIAVELYVKRARRVFDRVFCDPPFAYGYKQELIASIALSPLMGAGSLLMLHRPKRERLGKLPASLALRETREYGGSAVDFFQRGESRCVVPALMPEATRVDCEGL
jgi:16S rRNA (guanine(966)-N(2))-methyltransferase RsmD